MAKKKNRARIIKRSLIDYWKSVKLYKFYTCFSSAIKQKKQIIVMFDGKLKHGGISDRFWGIVSIYKYCKDYNIPFKLLFNHPFNLQDYLVANKVDWEIKPEDIQYDLKFCKPLYISLMSYDANEMYEIVKRKLKSRKQLHVYTNARTLERKDFGELFRELFKMSDKLKENYEKQSNRIKGPYVSCTFRFQQLLGDFKEDQYAVLNSNEEKEELIHKCKEVLKRLNNYVGCPILVTSDSGTFLKAISSMDNIITVEGKIIHPDFDKSRDNYDAYMKSFLDLFMIAKAEKVYLCDVSPLYRSGFPETAACIYNRPYYEIKSFNDLNIIRW